VEGEAAPEPPIARAGGPPVHDLVPVTLPGGLGAHKWRDRALLAALPPTALLCDLDGAVLEAAWGSVFAVEADALVTPPLDGRLLPGVVRAALLEAGAVAGLAVREEALDLERLGAARGVVLTSGVRLASAARMPGGPAPPAGLLAAVREALLARAGAPLPA
jgi:para-aminobenzoate synthetase/4-amino-4-deoxychorismate lyase